MSISAIIPTIGATLLIHPLLEVLANDAIPVTVYDNGCPDGFWGPLLGQPIGMPHFVKAEGLGIYEMWDKALWDAETDYVAILNDDIRLLPGSLDQFAHALHSDPLLDLVSADYTLTTEHGLHPSGVEYTHGTYRHGGVCGWAFMVRRVTYPSVGDGYQWWCGDDELVARITRNGRRTGIYRGVPVDHQGEASAFTQPWTHEAKARDLATFAARWS